MQPVAITPALSVIGQPSLDDFAAIAAHGFRAVINNRPDNEEPGQPSAAEEKRAADASGLGYTHIPVTGATLKEADIRAFQTAVAAAGGPVLAHCKSGTRALTLHVLGEVLDGRMTADQIRAFGEQYGFNLAGAETWLASRA